ncbi:MAG: 50S ribosomal protein L30 [bacterium]|nr:MAG: 50S ribosomal protein L30 [bacterium]
MAKKLKLTQVRSIIGSQRRKHRDVMKSLGFRKNYRTIYRNDTPQIRGMLNKVRHLVSCEEIDEKEIPAPAVRGAGYTVIKEAPASVQEPDVPEGGGEE